MRWAGALYGFALALSLALLMPDAGFVVGILWGFSLSGLGYLLGMVVERSNLTDR